MHSPLCTPKLPNASLWWAESQTPNNAWNHMLPITNTTKLCLLGTLPVVYYWIEGRYDAARYTTTGQIHCTKGQNVIKSFLGLLRMQSLDIKPLHMQNNGSLSLCLSASSLQYLQTQSMREGCSPFHSKVPEPHVRHVVSPAGRVSPLNLWRGEALSQCWSRPGPVAHISPFPKWIHGHPQTTLHCDAHRSQSA